MQVFARSAKPNQTISAAILIHLADCAVPKTNLKQAGNVMPVHPELLLTCNHNEPAAAYGNTRLENGVHLVVSTWWHRFKNSQTLVGLLLGI